MTHAPTYAEKLESLGLDAEGVTRARPRPKRSHLFSSVDPLAALMPGTSPYTYAFNNPLNFTDPSGMAPENTGADGLTNEQWMQSSRPGADPSLAGQYRADNWTDEIQQARIQSWYSKTLIHNPWAGDEVGRDVVDSRLQIAYSGAVVGINLEAASRLGQLLSTTGTGFSYMSLTTSALSEYHYSKTFNTFLGWNGRHAYTSWAVQANKYAPVIAEARVMGRMTNVASRGMSVVAAGASIYQYSQTEGHIHNKINLAGELGTATYASYGGSYGIAWGVGWEIGRLTTMSPDYQGWRNNTWMPYRYKTLGY